MSDLSFGIKTTPANVSYHDIQRVWHEADAFPEIEHAWLYDHLLPRVGDPSGPIYEGWTLLAALAAQTRRTLRIAAEHADLWNAIGPPLNRAEDLSQRSALLDEFCACRRLFQAMWRAGSPTSSSRRRSVTPDADPPSEEPRLPRSFRLSEDVERGEGGWEFAGTHAEGTRADIHRAQSGDGQQTAWSEAFDNLLVKPGISEEIAQDDIDGRTIRESAVEIDHVEPAAISDTALFRQCPGEANGDLGHVDSPDLQPPPGQPHRGASAAARQLQGLASRWKQVLVRSKERRTIHIDRSRSDAGVPLVPMDAVRFGHDPNDTRRRCRSGKMSTPRGTPSNGGAWNGIVSAGTAAPTSTSAVQVPQDGENPTVVGL
jgi:hypothetical protein